MRIREIHNDNVTSIIESEIYVINEHPNQAIKFLKDRNLDPDVSPIGKDVLAKVIEITNADGYTGLLTKFHVVDRLPFDEIKQLYDYLKVNKQSLSQLPKQPIQYERYADLHRDIEMLEIRKKAGLLVKELPSYLKREVKALEGIAEQNFYQFAERFAKLKDEYKQQFIVKISQFKNLHDLMDKLDTFLTGIESGEDVGTISEKIKNTEGADIIMYDEEKNILIAYIRKYDAANKLGCTASWCISTNTQQWRSYKKGGMKYFFMWDFNYDPSDSRYMVATAFNEKKPEGSATHVKNDKQVKLPEILNDKNLSIEIFSNFITKLRADFLASIDNTKGFLSSLKEYVDGTNTENLVTVLQQSETIQEHGKPEDIEDDGYESIEIGIEKNAWLEIFDIDEDEFSYIEGMTGYYSNYGDNEFYDGEHYNYMGGLLSNENQAIVQDIAKLFGFGKDKRKKLLEEEGELFEFFKKHDMEDLTQEIGEGYDEANTEAKSKIAQDAIDSMPIDINESSIKPKEILNYINDNEIDDVVSFDDFIEKASEHIENFDYSSIDEHAYSVVDYDNLNNSLKSSLTDVLEELQDPHSERAQKIQHIMKGIKLLDKLGFTETTNAWNIELPKINSVLTVKKIDSPYEYDEDSVHQKKGMVGITDEPSFESILIKKGKDPVKGNIRFSNMVNYVQQYGIPFEESVQHIKNVIKEEILGLI